MKDLFVLAAPLLLLVLGCDISKFASGGAQTNTVANISPANQTKPSPANTPKPAPSKPSLDAFLRRAEGKYPYEVKLLKNQELKARLKRLLGADYDDLEEYFNVQGPIRIEDGIFLASACQAHYCSNNYYIFVDLNGDNINVYHIDDEKNKHYFERGEIDLPPAFAKEISGEE
jgi:hypothetical protein